MNPLWVILALVALALAALVLFLTRAPLAMSLAPTREALLELTLGERTFTLHLATTRETKTAGGHGSTTTFRDVDTVLTIDSDGVPTQRVHLAHESRPHESSVGELTSALFRTFQMVPAPDGRGVALSSDGDRWVVVHLTPSGHALFCSALTFAGDPTDAGFWEPVPPAKTLLLEFLAGEGGPLGRHPHDAPSDIGRYGLLEAPDLGDIAGVRAFPDDPEVQKANATALFALPMNAHVASYRPRLAALGAARTDHPAVDAMLRQALARPGFGGLLASRLAAEALVGAGDAAVQDTLAHNVESGLSVLAGDAAKARDEDERDAAAWHLLASAWSLMRMSQAIGNQATPTTKESLMRIARATPKHKPGLPASGVPVYAVQALAWVGPDDSVDTALTELAEGASEADLPRLPETFTEANQDFRVPVPDQATVWKDVPLAVWAKAALAHRQTP